MTKVNKNTVENDEYAFLKRQKEQELYWLNYYKRKQELENQHNRVYDEKTFAKLYHTPTADQYKNGNNSN
jgi:hypothetical protein